MKKTSYFLSLHLPFLDTHTFTHKITLSLCLFISLFLSLSLYISLSLFYFLQTHLRYTLLILYSEYLLFLKSQTKRERLRYNNARRGRNFWSFLRKIWMPSSLWEELPVLHELRREIISFVFDFEFVWTCSNSQWVYLITNLFLQSRCKY